MTSKLNMKDMNQWALVTFALIGFIVGYSLNEITSSSCSAAPADNKPVAQAPTNPTPTAPPSNIIAKANAATVDDDEVLGEDDAPVTLIEFTDYECPFCGRHVNQTMDQIIEEYVDTGKIKYTVRDYPLGFHANAQKASEATECAADQGKFWEMHKLLFQNQKALGIDQLKGYAKDLGLDSAEFDSCLDDGTHAEEVKKDQQDGQKSGITGTPGFVLIDKDGNATKISGALPFASFQSSLDAALK